MNDETRSIEISETERNALASCLATAKLGGARTAIHRLVVRWDAAAPRLAEPVCDICGHEWRRHDPEDGECDAHSNERFSVCQCGRDLAWMQVKIAALSSAALDDGGKVDA